jgi:hypothetical protein
MGKIRLRHGDSEIELEGDEGFIERQLADFYSRFKINPTSVRSAPRLLQATAKHGQVTKDSTPAEYLKVHADLNVNGVMQLLLLGRYLEEVREKADFTPSDINQIAKEAKLPRDIHTQRFIDAVGAGLLRSDSGRYSLTSSAQEIFENPSEAKARSARPKTKKAVRDSGSAQKKTKAKSVDLEKFDPHKTDKAQSLEDLLIEKKPESAAEWLVVVGYYITKIKGQPSFSEGNVDYAYRITQRTDRPAHLRQVLINYKNNQDLFDFAPDGTRWVLTRTAEILVEDKLPRSKASG